MATFVKSFHPKRVTRILLLIHSLGAMWGSVSCQRTGGQIQSYFEFCCQINHNIILLRYCYPLLTEHTLFLSSKTQVFDMWQHAAVRRLLVAAGCSGLSSCCVF